MDPNLGSHIILAIIGAMAALGTLLTVLGFWSLGRANYRK